MSMSTDVTPANSRTPSQAHATQPVVLPDDLALCQQMIRELLLALREQRQDNEQLRHRLDLLLRRLYGQRAERYDPNQAVLFPEMLQAAEAEATPAADANADTTEDTTANTANKRGRHGRKELPKNLRRERIDYTLSEAERLCPCCGEPRALIGTTVSSQLDYEPAALYALDHVRHCYACKKCQGEVVSAGKAPQPIDKGLPGPGLLAYVVVSKYLDHLPLYRLEHIFARQGVDLSRSTLCDWTAATARLLRPLWQRMTQAVLRSKVIHTDDTPVPVQDAQRDRTRTGRLWGYLGDWQYPFNVFAYTPDRKQTGPQEFLQGYAGYLQADAFAGYDALYTGAKVTEAGCNAHARRKFYDVKEQEPEHACRALAYYRQLYDIERQLRELGEERRRQHPQEAEADWRGWWHEQRRQQRQLLAVPILQDFHAWLLAEQKKLLPKSPLAEAFTYALNQWAALTRYTTCGLLEIDNNAAEREMKRIAVGRKNWLFAGSDQGGATAAVLFSFVSTCQRLGLDAFVYLRDVLRRLPEQPADTLDELLPDRWQPLAPPPKTPAAEKTTAEARAPPFP